MRSVGNGVCRWIPSRVRRTRVLFPTIAAVLLLAGCATTPKTYSSPEALLSAYTAAGGKCADPTDIPDADALVGEGSHGKLCKEGVVFLLVFDEQAQANRYLAQEGKEAKKIVTNDRWVVIGDGVTKYASALGGHTID